MAWAPYLLIVVIEEITPCAAARALEDAVLLLPDARARHDAGAVAPHRREGGGFDEGHPGLGGHVDAQPCC